MRKRKHILSLTALIATTLMATLIGCALGRSSPDAASARASDATGGQPVSAQSNTQQAPTQAQQAPAKPGTPEAAAQANQLPFPIVPVLLEYEFAQKYYMQFLQDLAPLVLIEAIVSNGPPPVYQVITTERGGKRVYYCNSEAKVKYLTRIGKKAILTSINYRVVENLGEQPTSEFTFKDEKGTAFRWQFITASEPTEQGAGLTPSRLALSFLYRPLGTAAGEGTVVQVGDKVSQALPWPQISSPPYFVAYHGVYTIDSDMVSIGIGSANWRVKSAPDGLKEGAQWVLVDERNNERHMRISARHADELSINETDVAAPNTTTLGMVVKETPQGLAVRSVTLSNGSHSVRVAFKPELNIAAALAGSAKSEVAFQIDLGKQEKVVQGIIAVEKSDNMVQLHWRPQSPDWAKSRVISSTVAMDAGGYKIDAR